MKIPSSPRELAGCYEVRQVLGQSGKDLVFGADETVVRRGNDVHRRSAVAGLSIRIPENRFFKAWRLAQDKETWPTPSAPGPTCTKNKDRITMR